MVLSLTNINDGNSDRGLWKYTKIEGLRRSIWFQHPLLRTGFPNSNKYANNAKSVRIPFPSTRLHTIT